MAQPTSKEPPPAKVAFSPWRLSIGGNWQGGITSNFRDVSNIVQTNVPSLCGGGPCIPYNYERNIQGLGLSIGAGIRTKGLLEFHYTPVFRYDEIHFAEDNLKKKNKEFIVNHRLGVNKFFRGRDGQVNQYLGVSYTILNTGKRFNFYDSFHKQVSTLNLQFPSVTFSYGRSIYRNIYGEFQVFSLYKGLPHNHSRRYFMYGLSVYYNMNFSIKNIFSRK